MEYCFDVNNIDQMLHRAKWLWKVLFLGASAAALFAQNAPTLREGNTEIGLFVGGGYGLNVTGTLSPSTSTNIQSMSVPSFHAMFGGDVGYGITKSIFIVGESSYFPSLGVSSASSTTQTPTPGVTSTDTYTYQRRLAEFNGGIHYRLPVPESRFVPYLAGGLGGVHFFSSDVSRTTTCTPASGCSATGPTSAGSVSGATGFEVAFGAGARLYLSEHFGFRGEFRFYHPFDIANVGSFYRVSGGIFFQLK